MPDQINFIALGRNMRELCPEITNNDIIHGVFQILSLKNSNNASTKIPTSNNVLSIWLLKSSKTFDKYIENLLKTGLQGM